MKRRGLLLALALGLALSSSDATAQTHVAIGPRVGFDVANVEEMLIGADARIGHAELALEVQSSVDLYLAENGSFNTFSANLLYLLPVEDERLTPYGGAGVGVSFYDVGGQDVSNAGFNLVGGLRFHSSSAITPFVQTQITLGEIDLIALSGGLLFGL